MIQFSGASKRFGPAVLFEDLDWLIGPKDRIGVVGGNGAGKSTLLKIICGAEGLDKGELSMMRGIRLGYLPQEGLTLGGRTVFDECLSVFDDLRGMESEMAALTERMSQTDPASAAYQEMASRFHRLDTEFRNRGGYSIEAQAGAVLSGLGFRKRDWSRYSEEFSGGWQMRIALAKLLLEKPDMLLLDEPTNHLDLEARNWLEDYLLGYPYSYILISHDRFFLDVSVQKIVEIWNKRLWFYPGNYSKYLELKKERLDHLKAAARNQNERVEQLEAFINRFRYKASKARQVQSRVKELERMDRIQIPPEEETIHFNFPQPKPSGRIVAEFLGVQKRYGENVVLANVDFLIERGDRIALVGPNGAGKSTLIKLLAGTEPLTAGEYRLGHNAEPDYFAQDQYKELDPRARLFDDLASLAPNRTQTELRTLLGCFLFTGDDVFKQIGVLSGGERNRYALARLLLHPSNFLLLDEPTNHLDMRAKEVLLEALRNFTGTLVFVSHDRYFIDHLATKIFEIGGGEVRVYPGNYEDYLFRKQRDAEPPAQAPTETAPAPPQPPEPERRKRRINPIKLRQMKEQCSRMEQSISELEMAIAQTGRELSAFQNAAQSMRLLAQLEQQRALLNQRMSEWETLAEAISEAES